MSGRTCPSYKDSEEELNTAYAKFVKDSAQMNGAVKNAKRKDLQDRISGLQTKQTQLNEALETEKQRQLAPIREKMLKAIKDVAKEMGYDHVLYKESAIIFPAATDLTNSVKKKLGIQ
ncbi:MAG: OmpH family outer membrane protein [Chitinophagaceae bacterium]|nr:OmpH family outer membrane protein [Chitinophagaceae bacterium]